MKKFIVALMLTLGFALTFNLGNAQATNCKDVLGSKRYSCTFKAEPAAPPATLCVQFDDTNPAAGKFAANANGLPFQCTCQATGTLASPNFNADKSFICGEDSYGDAFVGKALGNKIKSGEYWCNGDCGVANVFECVVDPGCGI